MDAKEMKSKTEAYVGSVLKVALGAGVVLVGAYVISRLKEKQDVTTRLERIEQILSELTSEDNQEDSTT